MVGQKNGTTNLYVNKSYNIGNISSSRNVNGLATSVGGIIGYNTKGNSYIINSYSAGDLSNNSTTENTTPITGGYIGKSTAPIIIVNSYSTNNIQSLKWASGFVANNTSEISLNNVFNNSTSMNAGTTKSGLFNNNGGTYNVLNAYHLDSITGSNVEGVGTPKSSEYMRSAAFAAELNTNKNQINLTTEYGGALADYELSDWVYDSTLGYPVLDN